MHQVCIVNYCDEKLKQQRPEVKKKQKKIYEKCDNIL